LSPKENRRENLFKTVRLMLIRTACIRIEKTNHAKVNTKIYRNSAKLEKSEITRRL